MLGKLAGARMTMRQRLQAFGSTGAQIERPAGAPCSPALRREARRLRRVDAVSPTGWRTPALSH